MSHLWPENLMKKYSFPMEDIAMPPNVDIKELFLEIKKVERSPLAKVEGDERHGTISWRSPIPQPSLIPIIFPEIDSSYEYKSDEHFIRITIHKKLGPIIGVVEQHFLKEDAEFTKRIFLNAIKAVENNKKIALQEHSQTNCGSRRKKIEMKELYVS